MGESLDIHHLVCNFNFPVLANHLILRRTTLLGYPYTDCSSNGNHHACDVVKSSAQIETKCGCRSAYFGERVASLRECNYTDMVLCTGWQMPFF